MAAIFFGDRMDIKFYKELMEMADAAKVALETFEKVRTPLNGQTFRSINALAKACVQGNEIEPSIAIDLGPRRKQDLWDAIVTLKNGSYHGPPVFNPDKKKAIHVFRALAAEILGEKEQSEASGAAAPNLPPRGAGGQRDFVSPSRIEELRSLPPSRFDLTRLIRLCEELNVVNRCECHMAKAMLVRALIDHVPPIFDVVTFAQLASYSGGSRSFKDAIQRSGVLRAIADGLLHVQIRSSEVLPTANQVDCPNEVDAILGEIVRVLKLSAAGDSDVNNC
jgi:hypothetical protein